MVLAAVAVGVVVDVDVVVVCSLSTSCAVIRHHHCLAIGVVAARHDGADDDVVIDDGDVVDYLVDDGAVADVVDVVNVWRRCCC